MSQNKRDPMGADLLRQRRNLLITSLGLTAAQLAGATFQGSASIFGAGITFQEPVNLFYGAWVLWGYFLLRYWQCLGEESDLGISKAVSAWLLARFDLYDDDYDDGTRYWIGFRLPDIWVLYAYNEQRDDPDMSSKSSLDVQNSFIKICLFIRAYLVVAWKTPRFTDYMLPFFVAAFPLAFTIFRLIVSD